ncbi:hypothetical protein OESDEN_24509, partial [Oesophagostomum dentatum]
MPKGFQWQMLRIGPMCRYAEDIPLMMEILGGESVRSLHLRDEVNFSKIRLFYMEGVQHTPTVQSLSCEMRSALQKAVTYFEEKFDIEAIRLDLPLITKTIEIFSTSTKVDGIPKMAEMFLSLEGDRGSLNWAAELPKLLRGKSVHTPGAVFLSLFESLDKPSEDEKAE